MACTPDSVTPGDCSPGAGHHPSGHRVATALKQPTRMLGRAALSETSSCASCSALLRMGFTEPHRSPGALVVSYTTVSPLPEGARPSGGLFSVALACGSPRVGVTHHPALRSPDVPRRHRYPPGRSRSHLPGGAWRRRDGPANPSLRVHRNAPYAPGASRLGIRRAAEPRRRPASARAAPARTRRGSQR